MRNALLIVGLAAIIVIAGAWYAFEKNGAEQGDTMDTRMQSPIKVIPISHATAILEWPASTSDGSSTRGGGGAVFYTDPTGGADAFAGQPPADIVFVTDIHGDHLQPETLAAVLGDAVLVVPQAVKDQLPEALAGKSLVMKNGDSIEQHGFTITAIPMYNVPESPEAFHIKGRGNGYLIERDGTRLYIAGDTGGTQEMRALTNIDTALVPMNLPYTMSVDEAADAVLAFKPLHVYPYHYRGPDGLADVERFKQLVEAGDPSINVGLLDWYAAE